MIVGQQGDRGLEHLSALLALSAATDTMPFTPLVLITRMEAVVIHAEGLLASKSGPWDGLRRKKLCGNAFCESSVHGSGQDAMETILPERRFQM